MPTDNGNRDLYWRNLPTRTPSDDGCEFSPTCITCPLPKCKHEMTPSELLRARGFKGKLASVYEALKRDSSLSTAKLISVYQTSEETVCRARRLISQAILEELIS